MNRIQPKQPTPSSVISEDQHPPETITWSFKRLNSALYEYVIKYNFKQIYKALNGKTPYEEVDRRIKEYDAIAYGKILTPLSRMLWTSTTDCMHI